MTSTGTGEHRQSLAEGTDMTKETAVETAVETLQPHATASEHLPSPQREGSELEAAVSSLPSCLALFTAPWCGVDRLIRSEFDALSRTTVDNHEDIQVIDCNALPHLADRYRVDVFPTILLLEHGSERGRKTGAVSRVEIIDLVKELRR